MDDRTLERRLEAKDKQIAELVEALEMLVGVDGDLFSDEAHNKAREAIRKAKGE